MFLAFLINPQLSHVQFWVSNKGSDHFTGTREKPFATLNKALDSVAAINCNRYGNNNKSSLVNKSITINVVGGFYPISKPIVVNEYHHGNKNHPLIIKGVKNPNAKANGMKDREYPVISGGIQLNGKWRKMSLNNTKNNIWYLNVSHMNLNHTFNQLFANNKRCMRARDPQWGSFYHMKSTLPV